MAMYDDAQIRAQMDKQPWFGVDPKKSTKAVEFAKMTDPNKFATAEAFVKAIVDAVEGEDMAQTFILVLIYNLSIATVDGFATKEGCEASGAYWVERAGLAGVKANYFCIPGPGVQR